MSPASFLTTECSDCCPEDRQLAATAAGGTGNARLPCVTSPAALLLLWGMQLTWCMLHRSRAPAGTRPPLTPCALPAGRHPGSELQPVQPHSLPLIHDHQPLQNALQHHLVQSGWHGLLSWCHRHQSCKGAAAGELGNKGVFRGVATQTQESVSGAGGLSAWVMPFI